MSESPEFWLFVVSNLIVLLFGGVLTALSVAAMRRAPEKRALRGAAVGFGAITLGTVVEGVYELGIRDSYYIGGRELLVLHSVEGFLIAGGLAALFLSLREY